MQHKITDMISEEIVHIREIPKKLVVFLHGYIDSAPSLDKKLTPLYERLNDVAVHVPQAPVVCEIHECKRQWYSMHRFDPDDSRKFVPTMEECVSYYNRMTLGLQNAYGYIVPYVENALTEYGLTWKDLYLCGFSQGAMVAIYIALMHPEQIGGLVSFSGILAGGNYVMKHARSHPETLLIHGNADNLVRFEALEYTKNHLEQLGCKVSTFEIEGGQHMVTQEGLQAAADFICRLSRSK